MTSAAVLSQSTFSGIELMRFAGLRSEGLVHGIAGRHGGVSSFPFASLNLSVKTGDEASAVLENRRRFERAAGVSGRQIAMGKLRHEADVAVFKQMDIPPPLSSPEPPLEWATFQADAAIGDVTRLVLVMTFADCVPILLWDPDRRVYGLAHAGWRGTAKRIASATVQAMVRSFDTDPASVRAAMGPSIGSCCYTVGGEVTAEIERSFGDDATSLLENGALDLWAANQLDLQSSGVNANRIENPRVCTACRTDIFFSHRRERARTGRFGAYIGLLPEEGR